MSNRNQASLEDVTPEEAIRRRAETYQAIVDEAVGSRVEVEIFLDRLKAAGASSSEASDYGVQYAQRLEESAAGAPHPPSHGEDEPREATPEGLDVSEQDAFRQQREAALAEARARAAQTRRDAVETAAWKVLEAKLRRIHPAERTSQDELDLQARLASLLGENKPSTTSLFPSSILEGAPHLKALSGSSFDDPHLGSTWRLRRVFQGDIEGVIDGMRGQNISQPLPRSIWRLIIEDRYVDFTKLYASLDPGYDPNDEPKDFGGGYALVKKDHLIAKRPIRTESDWIRVFSAWESGVIILFPHRKSELMGYRQHVDNIFRAAPQDPIAAIDFDVEARHHYEKNPFRMDDFNKLQASLLVQMFRGRSSGLKRGHEAQSGPSSPPSKRASAICHNWNFGSCADPCVNRRKHGTCSECGEQHRALDSDSCFALLQARRGASDSGGGRV
jgi:hypothetical protein